MTNIVITSIIIIIIINYYHVMINVVVVVNITTYCYFYCYYYHYCDSYARVQARALRSQVLLAGGFHLGPVPSDARMDPCQSSSPESLKKSKLLPIT